MAQGDVYLNSTLMPGSSLKVTKGYLDFEVSDRTIDKTFVSDFVATKRTRSLYWENFLDEDFVDAMIALYLLKEDVVYSEVNSDLTITTFTVRMSISSEILREIDEGSYAYSGFVITMEEV